MEGVSFAAAAAKLEGRCGGVDSNVYHPRVGKTGCGAVCNAVRCLASDPGPSPNRSKSREVETAGWMMMLLLQLLLFCCCYWVG